MNNISERKFKTEVELKLETIVDEPCTGSTNLMSGPPDPDSFRYQHVTIPELSSHLRHQSVRDGPRRAMPGCIAPVPSRNALSEWPGAT